VKLFGLMAREMRIGFLEQLGVKGPGTEEKRGESSSQGKFYMRLGERGKYLLNSQERGTSNLRGGNMCGKKNVMEGIPSNRGGPGV